MSQFIPEPRNFVEVLILPEDFKKILVESNFEIDKNLIIDHTFLMYDLEKGDPVIPCMDVYKTNIQSDGSLAKFKLIILVRGYLQNRSIIGDTWAPTASMRTLNHFLSDNAKHKAIVHQLGFIGAFL